MPPGDGFTVDVLGFDAFSQALLHLGDSVIDAGADLLKEDVERHILEPSQELVPVESGRLKESGAVSDPVVIGEAVAVSVGYGGDNGEVSYALDQHENQSYQHQEGKTDKFLEKPILEWTKEGPARVARALVGLVKP